MKRKERKIKNIILVAAILGFYTLCVATAWATVTFIKPQDASYRIAEGTKAEIPVQISQESKGRAPEPSTMVLFGGGFLGMVMSFVRKTYALAKRIFDIIASVCGFVILAPLMVLIALLVKITSKGPILYSQTRVGKHGKNFEMYKFRTMRTDAEKDTGPVWAAENDDRLTPVGGFLRKTHIDELPQFVNILFGEMSLIGPRPERPNFVEEFKQIIPNYEKRLMVKPGITGLAQVWHRYDETIEDVKKKLKYDLLYVRRMNIWADISIFFRTFRVVLTGEGAR